MKYSRPWNIRAHEIFAQMKCSRPWNVRAHDLRPQDIRAYPKHLRIHKIYAPHQECLRLIIYDSNKAAVEIFAAYERCMRPRMYAQTLTIWARQNLQLLTPSQSGWRALIQMMLPLLHAVFKWGSALRPPSLYGRRLCRTVPACCTGTTCQNIRAYPNVRGREYFCPFSGKNQKPNSAHKCPITSVQIRT